MAIIMSRNERTLSVHNEHELLLKLEKAGVDDTLAQVVIDSPGNMAAQEVVALLQAKRDETAFRKVVFYFKDGQGKPIADKGIYVVFNHLPLGEQRTDKDGALDVESQPGSLVKMRIWANSPEPTLLSYRITDAQRQIVTYEISRIKV